MQPLATLIATLFIIIVGALPRPTDPTHEITGNHSELLGLQHAHEAAVHVGIDNVKNGTVDIEPMVNLTSLNDKRQNDPIAEYNNLHPNNLIPDRVLCFDPNIPGQATRYNRWLVWYALQQARDMRQYSLVDRPRWAGQTFPHPLDFLALNLHRVDLGYVDGEVYLYPITTYTGIWNTGTNPGNDRIVMDDGGNYLGLLAQRNGVWYWCRPVYPPVVLRQGLTAQGFPGVDETLRAPPVNFDWLNAAHPFTGGSHMG